MARLLTYVEIFGAKDYLSFDLSLARGLDYVRQRFLCKQFDYILTVT
jgi:histidyl-tRNA synthetase